MPHFTADTGIGAGTGMLMKITDKIIIKQKEQKS